LTLLQTLHIILWTVFLIRSDLAPVILQLKTLGIVNVMRFDFVSSPPVEMMMRALEVSNQKYMNGSSNFLFRVHLNSYYMLWVLLMTLEDLPHH
jgi:hypothetical protein